MAQTPSDYLGMYVGCEHQGCMGVAQVVEPDTVDARLNGNGFEGPWHIAASAGRPSGLENMEPVFCQAGSPASLAHHPASLNASQSVNDLRRDVYLSAALGGLDRQKRYWPTTWATS